MSEIRSYITISGHALDEYTFDPLEERPDIPDELRIEDIPNEPAYYMVQLFKQASPSKEARRCYPTCLPSRSDLPPSHS
jgi:hypothetical protein